MSVSKPFVFALVCDALGAGRGAAKVGVNAHRPAVQLASTAIERSEDGRTNPMVNPGAIATTSLVPGRDREAALAVRARRPVALRRAELSLDEEVYESASATNHRNRSIARLLESYGPHRLRPGPRRSTSTRGSARLSVTARDLAVMGATLADGGVNPLTREQVVGAETCRHTLAVMTTAGLYETSGDWLYDVGLPGKSGIGGGIVTVCPRARAGSGRSRRRSTRPATASRASSPRGSCRRRLGLDLFVSDAGCEACESAT